MENTIQQEAPGKRSVQRLTGLKEWQLCSVRQLCIFAVTIGIRGYDMYKDAIDQVSLEDKINEIRSKKS